MPIVCSFTIILNYMCRSAQSDGVTNEYMYNIYIFIWIWIYTYFQMNNVYIIYSYTCAGVHNVTELWMRPSLALEDAEIVYIYIYVCIYMCIKYTYIYIYICIYIYIHVLYYIYIYDYLHVCIYTCNYCSYITHAFTCVGLHNVTF